jgi:DNA-binding NarL/FixJ family response regulator
VAIRGGAPTINFVETPTTMETSEPNERLSPRELQVLEMASHGLRNAEIAQSLSVSVHAVKFHLAAIYRKLGVSNRTEAAVAHLHGDAKRETA